MTLEQYRKSTGVSYTYIAGKCDCSITMISETAAGRNTPSFELALKIEAATNGQVSRENWYPSRPPEISITIGATST